MMRINRKSRQVNLRLLTKIDKVFAANSEFQYLENRLKIGFDCASAGIPRIYHDESLFMDNFFMIADALAPTNTDEE